MPLQLCPIPKGSPYDRHSKTYIIHLERLPESVWDDEWMLLVATLIPIYPLKRAGKRDPEESCLYVDVCAFSLDIWTHVKHISSNVGLRGNFSGHSGQLHCATAWICYGAIGIFFSRYVYSQCLHVYIRTRSLTLDVSITVIELLQPHY
ncbi:hypothetical protein EDD85DRAFT_946122 [Armillaria nabsnona]|nr:hypothetical protein EDD85DRAFT_946122 [Armillaria nabsnona]